MAYVDLNPIPAGMARTPEHSDYTSVQQRISDDADPPLVPFNDNQEEGALPAGLPEYLALVEWSGRIVVPGKRGRIPKGTPAILERLRFEDQAWIGSMKLLHKAELRALGPMHRLTDFARKVSRKWIRGKSECQAVFGP